VQLKGIAFVAIFAPVATTVILGVLKLVFGSLRVDPENEAEGLDLSEHSEAAYTMLGGGGSMVSSSSSGGGGHAMAGSLAHARD
jgi:hypothetical protein